MGDSVPTPLQGISSLDPSSLRVGFKSVILNYRCAIAQRRRGSGTMSPSGFQGGSPDVSCLKGVLT